MIRLLLDEMISPAIASQINGVDVRAVAADAALRGASDDHVLAVALAESRIVVTANIKDFVPLAQAWAATGRVPPPLLLVSTKRFPTTPQRVARIAGALRERLSDDRWPTAGQRDFL